jgi:hypothetical protein
MEALRPNNQRAKTALIFLWIVFGLNIISLISECMQYNLLQSVSGGGLVTEEEASSNDLRERFVSILYALVYIPCGILFICWFRRAYYNLHLRTDYLRYDEGWAAGGWFVPFLNLVRPFQIMRELYEETDAILVKRSEGYTERTNKMLLGFWWALWVISSILGRIFYKMDTDTLDEMISFTENQMLLSVITIPLGLMAIKLVRDYSQMETLLRELPEPSVEPESVVTPPDAEQPIEPAV